MMLMRKFRNRESDWIGPIHYYIGLMLACCTQTQSQPKSHVRSSILGQYLQSPPPNKALLVAESDQRLSIFQAFGSVIAISLCLHLFASTYSSIRNLEYFCSLPLLSTLWSFISGSMLYAVSAPKPYVSSPRSYLFQQRHLVSTRLSVRASLPDNNNGVKVEYTPWLIVGLGNPGNKYHGTRHNVGFEMIDQIARAEGVVMNTIQSKALIGIGCIKDVPILLAKPQAYMNFSGESVGSLAAHYQVPLRHIILIYDEMSLPNGVVRLQPKGGHGHHNGVKNVIDHLDGCREFPRLCIGIGNPPGTMDMRAFLLQKFSSTEREQIDAALEQANEAVRTLVLNGFNRSITRFNLGQKYKYNKV